MHKYIAGKHVHKRSSPTQLGYDYHNLTSINRNVIHSKLGEGANGGSCDSGGGDSSNAGGWG